jgi:hypothetical protein
MNDRELDLALRSIHHERMTFPDSDAVVRYVLGVPIEQTPPQRGFFEPLTGRFQTMFSATKFVVAGVIVALFGGFLLTNVLTQQGEQSLPEVGASASEEIRSDLLPGVDLEVEEVGPRLVRVLGDGERQTLRNIVDVAVAPNGDVWVRRQNGTVYRLGAPGNAFQQRAFHPHGAFHRHVDGTLRIADRRLEGERWVKDPDRFCADRGRLALDGTCWVPFQPGAGGALRRLDESGQRFDIDSVAGYPPTGLVDIAPDGTVWTTLSDESSEAIVGLASYDGSAWTPFEIDAVEGSHLISMAVAPDGVVWMLFFSDGPSMHALSWDGATWKTYSPLGIAPARLPWIEFLPDGSPLFAGVAELDGDALRPFEVLASIGDGTSVSLALDNAADGSTWVVVGQPDDERGGLYVITPEAVANE